MSLLDRIWPFRKSVPQDFAPEIPGRWINIVPGEHGFLSGFQSDVRFDFNHDTVLRFQAVFACSTLIAQDIGKLRPRLMQLQKNGIRKEVTSAAFSPVLRKPNHYQDRIQFIESWILSKMRTGKCYVLKERDNRGVVIALHVLHPDRVWPLVAEDGSVFYRVMDDRLAGVVDSIMVPDSEIINNPMNCLFHPLVGTSPIFAAAMPAMQALRIQGSSIRLFENMAQPGGILTAQGSISEESANALKKQWAEAYSGRNSGKVAVLADGLKFEAIQMKSTDAQLIEQLKWSGSMVCSVYHVPAYMVGMADPPAYNNIEALNQQYFSQCLQSLIESLEVSLDEGLALPPGYCVKLDLKGLLRMDTATRYKAHSDAIAGGWLAPNEARAEEDLDPVAGGDTPYMQQQNFSLEQLAKRPAPGQEPAIASEPELDTLAALKSEVDALKSQIQQRSYRGIYRPGERYLKENSVTRGGSLYIARANTHSVPGTDETWQLAVKKGRDGKDAGLRL